MIESMTGKAVLVLGVQLPLVIGITAWLAKRDGVKIGWLRVGVISTAIFAVLTAVLWLVATSPLGTRDTVLLALSGTVAGCLAVTWFLTRQSRQQKPNQASEATSEPGPSAGSSSPQG